MLYVASLVAVVFGVVTVGCLYLALTMHVPPPDRNPPKKLHHF